MPDPTPNLGLERPDFNVATWHDQVNDNFTILDAAVAGLVNITGVWENSVAYVIGDFVVDSTDATIWECLVSHTSSASGPMSVDRLANPTYWQQVADIATLAAQAQASADSALASAAAAAASAAAAATSGSPFIDIVEDYGADNTGTIVSNSAFLDFTADYQGQKVMLYLQPGSYKFSGNPTDVFQGIYDLTILGYGASMYHTNYATPDNYFSIGSAFGELFGDPTANTALIANTNIGDTTVTCLTVLDAGKFAVGDSALVSGLELQGNSWPFNPYYFEYVTVSGVNTGTGVVSFSGLGLRDGPYQSDWPSYIGFTDNKELTSGPASIYKVDDGWTNIKIIGVHFLDPNVNINCRDLVFEDCLFDGSINPSQCRSITLDHCVVLGLNRGTAETEFDKLVEEFNIRDCFFLQGLLIASSCKYVNIERSRMPIAGTSRYMHISDCNIPSLAIGPRNFGTTEQLQIENCTVSSVSDLGSDRDPQTGATTSGWTYSNGIISQVKDGGVFGVGGGDATTVPPGCVMVGWDHANQIWDRHPFTIAFIFESGGNVYWAIDLTAAEWAQMGDRIVPHPCYNVTVKNSTGCEAIEDLSAAPDGAPFWSFTKRRFFNPYQLGGTDHIYLRGYVKELCIDVQRAYTGVQGTLTFREDTTQGINSSAGFLEFNIDAKTVGKRYITRHGNWGIQSSDGTITAGWETGFLKRFIGAPELSADITSEAISTWPIIELTAFTTHSRSPDIMRTDLPFTARVDIINVKDYGAIGDGSTDDTAALQAAIFAAFKVNLAAAGGTDPALWGQRPLYIPAGVYKVTSSLSLLGTYGAVMMGAGRLSSRIKGIGCNPIVTNGCAYSRFSDFSIEADGGICFDLDWDGSTYISCQSNTFENMLFQNVAIGFTSYGVRIGQTAMGSENTFLNCYWSDCDFGLITKNYNALQNQVIGGNFAGGDFAIYVDAGSVPVVSSVGFQNTSTFDIQLDNSAEDTMTVTGCRTESQHFIKTAVQPVVISGCNQTNATSGTFLESNASALTPYCTLSSCISIAGKLRAVYGTVDNCQFGRDDWADGNCTFWVRHLVSGKTLLGGGSGTPHFDYEGYYTAGVWKIYRSTDYMAWDNFATSLTVVGGTSATLAGADLIVPDDPYDATNWNANLEVPTKNAVRDKIETLSAGAAAQIREVTAAGAITVNAITDDVIIVNKTVGAATTVNLPAVASRSTSKPYYIVDGKLDAGTNNITIDPNGAETILGLSTWLINTNGGAVTIWPMPSGGKWYIT